MQLVVGLGNPGLRYAATRHNVGFRVVDVLAARWSVEFHSEPHYLAATADGPAGRVTLLKPQTYMNRSGEAIVAWAADCRVEIDGSEPAVVPDEAATPDRSTETESPLVPIVVCDDLALPLGSLRIRPRGSGGGQKGLESVITAVGGAWFPRVRLGVAGASQVVTPDKWSDYVLSPFSKDEQSAVSELIELATDAVEHLLVEGPAVAAQSFNRTIRPLPNRDQSDILPP